MVFPGNQGGMGKRVSCTWLEAELRVCLEMDKEDRKDAKNYLHTSQFSVAMRDTDSVSMLRGWQRNGDGLEKKGLSGFLGKGKESLTFSLLKIDRFLFIHYSVTDLNESPLSQMYLGYDSMHS